MSFPSVTYTFANSTTADGPQVSQNFTDLINGMSDGTKDLSVSALTCASTATLHGAVILGNSGANDITWNGSLASNLAIKTTNTYDIGTSTIGLRALYFGANSFTTKIVGSASMAASYTLTLPTNVPANTNSKIISTAGGVLSFTPASVLPGVTASKTANYTAVSSDDVILCDSNSVGAFTVTLPAASAFAGKVLTITKTTSDVNAVTIARAGSDLINGATNTSINTQYETLTLVSDGTSAWYIMKREYPRTWGSSVANTINGVTSNPTKGTTTSDGIRWRRDGQDMLIEVEYVQTVAGSAGSGTYLFPIPSSWVADTGSIGSSTTSVLGVAGSGLAAASADGLTTTTRMLLVSLYNSTNLKLAVYDGSGSTGVLAGSGNTWALSNAVRVFHFSARVPISGWN